MSWLPHAKRKALSCQEAAAVAKGLREKEQRRTKWRTGDLRAMKLFCMIP